MLNRVSSLLLLVLLSCRGVQAQDKELLPRVSFRGTCASPIVISSKAYNASFKGVVDGGLTVNIRLFGNFSVGLGYKGTLMQAEDFYTKQRFLATKEQIHEGVLRLGVDRVTGPKGFLSIALNVGYGLNKYTAVKAAQDSLNGRHPTEFTAAFIRPEISYNFKVEENFAFGVLLAYNMELATFDPRMPCFDTYGDAALQYNKANMSWISFGFGFYYGLKKKKG